MLATLAGGHRRHHGGLESRGSLCAARPGLPGQPAGRNDGRCPANGGFDNRGKPLATASGWDEIDSPGPGRGGVGALAGDEPGPGPDRGGSGLHHLHVRLHGPAQGNSPVPARPVQHVPGAGGDFPNRAARPGSAIRLAQFRRLGLRDGHGVACGGLPCSTHARGALARRRIIAASVRATG